MEKQMKKLFKRMYEWWTKEPNCKTCGDAGIVEGTSFMSYALCPKYCAAGMRANQKEREKYND